MAAAAELLSPPTEFAPEEEYARSLAKARAVGHLIVTSTVEVGAHVDIEAEDAFLQQRADFRSGISEMIRTDPEFHGSLDIDDEREHQIINGQVCDIDGKPMVDLVSDGWRVSSAMARIRPELAAQAERDEGDVITAQTVDGLAVGESYFVVSMDPKAELRDMPEVYKDELGYREGLLYIQRYTKVDATKVICGSHSVDMSDENVWRGMLAEIGVVIPGGESPNRWIRNGFTRQMDAGEAARFATGLRQAYYQRRGVQEQRFSVREFVEANDSTVNQRFKMYYTALSKAVYSGNNNETLRGLAGALLQTGLSAMKSEIRSQLVKVANSSRFDDTNGRTMDAVIRYAVVEELRNNLKRFMAGLEMFGVGRGNQSDPGAPRQPFLPPEQIHLLLARGVSNGVAAGRSYGGCANQVELSVSGGDGEAGSDAIDELSNSQLAYGGRSNNSSRSEGVGKIRIDSCRVPACPTRPWRVKVGGCGVCLQRCQRLFDRGIDPTKEKPREVRPASKQKVGLMAIIGNKGGEPKASKTANRKANRTVDLAAAA
jgi:hypothetical protein